MWKRQSYKKTAFLVVFWWYFNVLHSEVHNILNHKTLDYTHNTPDRPLHVVALSSAVKQHTQCVLPQISRNISRWNSFTEIMSELKTNFRFWFSLWILTKIKYLLLTFYASKYLYEIFRFSPHLRQENFCWRFELPRQPGMTLVFPLKLFRRLWSKLIIHHPLINLRFSIALCLNCNVVFFLLISQKPQNFHYF